MRRTSGRGMSSLGRPPVPFVGFNASVSEATSSVSSVFQRLRSINSLLRSARPLRGQVLARIRLSLKNLPTCSAHRSPTGITTGLPGAPCAVRYVDGKQPSAVLALAVILCRCYPGLRHSVSPLFVSAPIGRGTRKKAFIQTARRLLPDSFLRDSLP